MISSTSSCRKRRRKNIVAVIMINIYFLTAAWSSLCNPTLLNSATSGQKVSLDMLHVFLMNLCEGLNWNGCHFTMLLYTKPLSNLTDLLTFCVLCIQNTRFGLRVAFFLLNSNSNAWRIEFAQMTRFEESNAKEPSILLESPIVRLKQDQQDTHTHTGARAHTLSLTPRARRNGEPDASRHYAAAPKPEPYTKGVPPSRRETSHN